MEGAILIYDGCLCAAIGWDGANREASVIQCAVMQDTVRHPVSAGHCYRKTAGRPTNPPSPPANCDGSRFVAQICMYHTLSSREPVQVSCIL